MAYVPRPGDYGVVKTNGTIGALIRIGTMSRWNHTFIYIGGGLIVEANPTGVQISPADKYPVIAWNRHEALSDAQRTQVVEEALALVGKSYSFLNIALLALRILGLKLLANSSILKVWAKREGYICSELVSECYSKSGVDLCGKPNYLCVPGDLAERLIYQ